MRVQVLAACAAFLFVISVAATAAEIEEIVVTAEKRESALQDTPVAVSAVSRETIEVRGLDDFQQLQFMVPGLVFSEVADMAQITMRGVGVDISEMMAEPGVALHVDGIYRGGLVSSSSLLFDVERIEVLRGPQGTLFGRNSTGGNLNVVSRLPGEDPAFSVSALYGDYDRTRFEVSGDAPIVPGVFAVRAAVAHEERDGYATNRFNGREEDEAESTNAKVSAVISPSDTVEIILRGEYLDSEVGGPPIVVSDDHPVAPLYLSTGNPGGVLAFPGSCGPVSCVDAFGLNLSPAGVFGVDPRNPFSTGRFHSEREGYGLSAEIIWDVSDALQFKSISSYYEIEQNCDKVSIDGSSIDSLVQGCFQDNQEWSQELTLSGSSGDLDWIAGVYYYESDMSELWDYELPAFQATFEALFGIFGGGGPLPPGSLAFFGTKIDGTSTPVPFLQFNVFQDTTSIAAYGQATYNFSDRLRGTLGVRWTEDEKDYGQTVVNNLGGDFCVGLDLNDDWSEVTGKAGLDYDLTDATMVYGSVSSGFKAGGFNGGSCNNPYDPETLLAYEIGSKSRFFDNSMQLNLTAFYYDYEDYQARLFINNASIVENAADAITYGFEAEMLWLVSENFRMDASVSLLHAEFEDFMSTDPLNPDVGMNCDATGLSCLQQLEGNDLLRSPDTKFSFSAEYDIGLDSAGILTLRGEYSYTDEMYHTVFNNDFALQDDISLTNFRVIWTPAGGQMEGVRVIAFVDNLTDEEFVATHIPNATTGGTLTQYGPPRTWGITVRYSR